MQFLGFYDANKPSKINIFYVDTLCGTSHVRFHDFKPHNPRFKWGGLLPRAGNINSLPPTGAAG